MSQQQTLPNIKKIASSVASVVGNAHSVHVLIFGGGRGGLALLELLRHYEWIHIHAIVDINHDALAFSMAHQLGISISIDQQQALQDFHGDIVIDVTGDQSMTATLATLLAPRQIELISGKSAKLVFDLVNKQLGHTKTIASQNTRLDMLDSMLEITTQLESHPPLADLMRTSLLSVLTSLQATHGLVIIFNDDASDIAYSTHAIAPASAPAIISEAQQACGKLNHHHRFKWLDTPIHDHTTSYHVILPIWHQESIIAMLLLSVANALNREQRTTLNMSSIHLNTACKILQQYNQLEEMAINDALTGMYNRRYFDQKLHQEVSRIQRSKLATLSCAFIDIDDFKQVNDHYGHQMGDLVLQEVAQSISRSIRDYDTCARYGGDEFVVLLPTDALSSHTQIEQVGLRMLKNIADIRILQAPDLRLSISIGIATQSSETADEKTLLKLADHAVYQAKEAGKNCLRLHADEQFHYSNARPDPESDQEQ